MNAYLCTYRLRSPSAREESETQSAGKDDPLFEKFLLKYDDSYYDWGDDPAFFAAKHKLHDVRKASWGVCRPDVRKSLDAGDVIVFFCARLNEQKPPCRYHFIGFGTVKEVIKHGDVWA